LVIERGKGLSENKGCNLKQDFELVPLSKDDMDRETQRLWTEQVIRVVAHAHSVNKRQIMQIQIQN
jgi:hypothetical protein